MDELRHHGQDGTSAKPLGEDADLHADPLDRAGAMIMDRGTSTALADARQRLEYWHNVVLVLAEQAAEVSANERVGQGGIN